MFEVPIVPRCPSCDALTALLAEADGILRDIRPVLDAMRGEVSDGPARTVFDKLIARIDRARA
jgi:hypothetical protein